MREDEKRLGGPEISCERSKIVDVYDGKCTAALVKWAYWDEEKKKTENKSKGKTATNPAQRQGAENSPMHVHRH